MTYKKNFVAAIKVNGKILRESSDQVELPFGSEYSVLLKNMDTVRMQARISIDGEDATGWLIVGPNSSIDVERFVKDLDRGNRFKFIERTEKIEQHRGIKAEDGLIRIEFKRERVYEAPKVVEHHTYYHHYPYYRYPWVVYPGCTNDTFTYSSGSLGPIRSSSPAIGSRGMSGAVQNAQSISLCSVNNSEPISYNTGITVPGSLSNQKFTSVQGFDTDQSEVIVLHLVGKKDGEPVKVAKTVKTMLRCETCGRTSKSSSKFCKECGTSLEKV
jgi:hypothetical protein